MITREHFNACSKGDSPGKYSETVGSDVYYLSRIYELFRLTCKIHNNSTHPPRRTRGKDANTPHRVHIEEVFGIRA